MANPLQSWIQRWLSRNQQSAEADNREELETPTGIPIDQTISKSSSVISDPEGLVPTYAEIHRDEIYRLGYVAVTRARWGVIWIPKPEGSIATPTSSSAYSEFAVAVNAAKQRANTKYH